jgi:hypothetical protein
LRLEDALRLFREYPQRIQQVVVETRLENPIRSVASGRWTDGLRRGRDFRRFRLDGPDDLFGQVIDQYRKLRTEPIQYDIPRNERVEPGVRRRLRRGVAGLPATVAPAGRLEDLFIFGIQIVAFEIVLVLSVPFPALPPVSLSSTGRVAACDLSFPLANVRIEPFPADAAWAFFSRVPRHSVLSQGSKFRSTRRG